MGRSLPLERHLLIHRRPVKLLIHLLLLLILLLLLRVAHLLHHRGLRHVIRPLLRHLLLLLLKGLLTIHGRLLLLQLGHSALTLVRLRHHILVEVVNGVGPVGSSLIILYLHLIQVLINLVLEALLDHLLAFRRGQLICQPQQKFILLPLRLFAKLAEGILQVIEVVIAEFEEEFDHCVRTCLLSATVSLHIGTLHVIRCWVITCMHILLLLS